MNIISDPNRDVRSSNHQSGGYEWWYFDGISEDGRYSFVIIFYEGNPFSTRYNASILDKDSAPVPTEYPAISISVYDQDTPIFYSFTEFNQENCQFDADRPFVNLASHEMEGFVQGQKTAYDIKLRETLPNGDTIDGEITFESSLTNKSLFDQSVEESSGHYWNLVQPRADISVDMTLQTENEVPKEITFRGRGYHDHNTGTEPMRNEFTDWYWGRFHFDCATLVYYVMNRRDIEQHRAWLISNDNRQVLTHFTEVDLVDKGLSIFGLKTARKIGLRSGEAEVQIQQSRLLDNGPFYQRFLSDAYLRIPDKNIVESRSGISEYIRPDRIYSRIFWPFVDMRIQYKAEGPHWVQKSKKLYRWTW